MKSHWSSNASPYLVNFKLFCNSVNMGTMHKSLLYNYFRWWHFPAHLIKALVIWYPIDRTEFWPWEVWLLRSGDVLWSIVVLYRSEGLLCAGWPHTHYSSQSEVLDKLFTGKFKWVTSHASYNFEPMSRRVCVFSLHNVKAYPIFNYPC